LNILVSGATGFVGVNLVQELNKSHRIFTLGRTNSDFNWATLDAILNEDIDLFIHLAGKAHDTAKVSDEAEYYEVNTALTEKLYKKFLLSQARLFIFMSSVKAVVDQVDYIMDESHLPQPITPYGRSKRQAEEYLLANLPKDNQKSIVILRPCIIHGQGNKGNLNLLYRLIQKGLPWPLAAFENERSYLSITNLCFIISEIIKKDRVPTGIYNVADDESISTNDLVKLIARVSGKRIWLWSIPVPVLNAMARLGDLLGLPFNKERLDKLTESYVVSNDKIKDVLGISEMPTDVRAGLKATLRSF
jgi:nucleoside-diphosphate-sugar epimerase